ncbi:uncharacterized protein LACBIDRAFT_321922 [Laccaria bicolor S238N-H82]|uniref:Predicted protein n=1 Tax=Laccaria bicolor (strain S238N-H82 / ATCC MYA-4686) TaxID=486041 RepID=B0CUM8_LACBS|nr:uncharacterized protein LACBIDRAFT_321922 [Laccaria bicolor S238N-H82]EDR14700.1 predicted protein [Laccaria bicolor S238N-H82]|eukprot:XP_001875259.1 predicted protein [Laccaria bicolor S238N-H82]
MAIPKKQKVKLMVEMHDGEKNAKSYARQIHSLTIFYYLEQKQFIKGHLFNTAAVTITAWPNKPSNPTLSHYILSGLINFCRSVGIQNASEKFLAKAHQLLQICQSLFTTMDSFYNKIEARDLLEAVIDARTTKGAKVVQLAYFNMVNGMSDFCSVAEVDKPRCWKLTKTNIEDNSQEEVVLRIQGIVCNASLPPVKRPFKM